MRFLHISKEGGVTKETFEPPVLSKKENLIMHSYNLLGGFYLAKADEHGDSMWFKARQRMSEKDDPWLVGTRHYYDVDFEKHRIYNIDSVEDLITFFARYGCIEQRLCHNHIRYSHKISTEDWMKAEKKLKAQDRLRIKRYKLLHVLNAFLDTIDTNMCTPSFEAVKEQRTLRNMPLVTFSNGQIVQPKKITFRFLVDVVRTKEAFEAYVGDFDPSTIITRLDAINYPLLRKDGYNGIYYSTNIVKFAEDMSKTIIAAPDIPSFPDIVGYTSKEDLELIERNIKCYIQWLLTDTLILWKWVF
jgi:hypothetical protein